MADTPELETIEETTVGMLGDARVAAASMHVGDYDLPDGTTNNGLTCVLVHLGGDKTWVGMGSVATIDGIRWEVVGIEKPSGRNGTVTLRMLDG